MRRLTARTAIPAAFRTQTRTRRSRRSRGQGLVEFALILPVFLVLLSTALDLGRIAYGQIAIENAAREGAFQASVTPTSFAAGQPCPAADPITGKPATNLVICRALLEAEGSGVELTPSDVALRCSPSCTVGLGHTASVTVTGRLALLTPFMAAIFGGYDVTFTSTATNQIETLPEPLEPTMPTPPPTPTPEPTPTPTPTPTPPPACTLPSAGFTYTSSPTNGRSPVTVTVTDTSSSSPSCPITSWAWEWGDGVTTYGRTQAPHTFYNFGPAANKTYSITLTVTNSTGSSTSGAVIITVKK